MGFEPTTPTLARLCSTPELHPLTNRCSGVKAELRAAAVSLRRAVYGASHFEMQQENMHSAKFFLPVNLMVDHTCIALHFLGRYPQRAKLFKSGNHA